MLKYLKIATKNIIRHKRRTILILIMISSGVIISIFLEGILEDMRRGWLKAIVHTQTGHLQIMPAGYLKKDLMSPLDSLISSPQKIEEFLNKQDEVISYTKRLNFSGMVATPEKTTIFNGVGVDPINEYEVFSLLKEMEKGKPISLDKPNGCVIGRDLASNLNVDIGSILTLVSVTKYGALNAINVEIVGIFRSGQREVDSMFLAIGLDAAYKLLDINNEVSNIICILENIKYLQKFKEKLTRFIKSNFKDKLEIHSWDEIATLYKKVMSMQTFTTKIIELIIFFLIAIAICTVMLMSVFERTREIGTMTAFGIKRTQIMTMFLSEAFIIGVFGGIIGVILGTILNTIIYLVGIPFVPPGTERVVYMRPALCFDKMIVVYLLGIISTIIGGFYPSRWASKIKPIEALKSI